MQSFPTKEVFVVAAGASQQPVGQRGLDGPDHRDGLHGVRPSLVGFGAFFASIFGANVVAQFPPAGRAE